MKVKTFEKHSIIIKDGILKNEILKVKYQIGNKYMVQFNDTLKCVDVEDGILVSN